MLHDIQIAELTCDVQPVRATGKIIDPYHGPMSIVVYLIFGSVFSKNVQKSIEH